MWNAVVLAVLVSLAGIYSTRNVQTLDQAHADLAKSSAAEMSLYRKAVIDYFSEHNLVGTRVDTATLKNGGYLPAWSRLFQQSTPLAWGNYRDAQGVIYIYCVSSPPQNLASELARLAQNSVLLGIYRTGAATLRSPAYGDTGIPVSAISAMSIPDDTPVWIARTK